MPAHFAVGQGGTAQHIPSAPLPKARQRHPAYKGNKPALLHIPGQERGYTIQHTRAHCQEQGHASNPCPRVLRWGRAAPLQVHPARKNHWPRAWRATPPPLRVSRQGQRPAASPTRSGIARAALPSAAKRPCAKRERHQNPAKGTRNGQRVPVQAARPWNLPAASARPRRTEPSVPHSLG